MTEIYPLYLTIWHCSPPPPECGYVAVTKEEWDYREKHWIQHIYDWRNGCNFRIITDYIPGLKGD